MVSLSTSEPSAAFVTSFLAFIAFMHHVALYVEKQRRIRIPLLLHYYTWLFGFMFLLMGRAFITSFFELRTCGYLDPSLVKERFKHHDGDWEEEVNLEHDKWLRYLSLFTPIPVIATFAISSWHVRAQLKRVRALGKLISDLPCRDNAITIIALPLLYSCMSFQAVRCSWKVFTNTAEDLPQLKSVNWIDKKDFLDQVYETNFMVADLYEAWALYRFAETCLIVISEHLRTECNKLSALTHAIVDDDGMLDDNEKTLLQNLKDVLRTMEKLRGSVQSLVMQGTHSFVGACLVQSVFYVINIFLVNIHLQSVEDFISKVQKAKFCFSGMGALASTAAISGIITVEHDFEDFLHPFKPFWKFWGTKILVSISFLQTCVLSLPPFNALSQSKQNLFYASMLCYQALLVAVMHLYAWRVDEQWYSVDLSGAVALQRSINKRFDMALEEAAMASRAAMHAAHQVEMKSAIEMTSLAKPFAPSHSSEAAVANRA